MEFISQFPGKSEIDWHVYHLDFLHSLNLFLPMRGGTGHWVLGITCVPDVYDMDVYDMDSIPEVPGNSGIESKKQVLREKV